MARIRKHKNDKFYTKKETALELISLLDLSKYEIVIEPSAGNGSFSNNINHKNLISLDIEPESDNIIKMNWFDFKLEKKSKVLAIGNPPFGNQGSLAFSFIKKCDELEIDTIAFILPKSFKKETLKNRIPLLYHLVKEIELKDNSYTLLGENYSVPSIFQIWERKEYMRNSTKLKTKSDLIKFVKKNENPDYSMRRVGFYAGMVYEEINEKSEQSHYFIKASEDIVKFLKNYKWQHNNTSGPRSIGKSEIIKVLEEYEKSKKK